MVLCGPVLNGLTRGWGSDFIPTATMASSSSLAALAQWAPLPPLPPSASAASLSPARAPSASAPAPSASSRSSASNEPSFSSSADEVDIAAAHAAYAVEERRRHTVLEIWETELKYVQCLSIAQAVYVLPLRGSAARRPAVVAPAQCETLFGNIDEVIALAKEVRARKRTRE